MERYENIIKIEEIRRLTDDNQYVKALKILKTVDTKKIKSLTDLSIIADVYTQNEEYDDAINILTRIYAKNKTRRIVYQLVDLSIKRGDIYESEYYLDKYKKLASRDSYQYIFRYCIDKLKQEPYDVLIESLEKLKEYEYFEVWAYELAKLYHKAGMKDRCVRECSDIILWFGNGIYVEKARLLKAYYVGEIDPIQMLKAKEKREAEMRLGLDKTKDYSNIRSEIDKFLAKNDEESPELENNHNENKVISFVPEDEYGVSEITDELLSSVDAEDTMDILYSDRTEHTEYIEDTEEKELVHIWERQEYFNPEVEKSIKESKEESSIRDSAYEELYSAGVFSTNGYEEKEDTNVEEEAVKDDFKGVVVEKIPEEIEEVEEIEEIEEIEEVEEIEDVERKKEIEEIKEIEEEAPEEIVDEIENMIHLLHLKENVFLKRIFGYFICHQECGHQIEAVFNRLLLKKGKGQNFIIMGQRKSGKTTLSKCFAKALYEQNLIKSPKVAKITAAKLGGINLLERIDVLVDGMLIIEEASNLAHNTVEQIIQVSKTYGDRLLISLEDEEDNIEELLKREENLSDLFEHVIRIPEFTRNDKLGFVLCFLEDQEYKLSLEGKEILINALEEIEKHVEEAEQLEVFFDFVKKAKLSADKRNKSLLLDIMQSRNLETNDLLYIKKEDFYE